MDEVIYSARLHDIGKIYISDLILNKKDILTPEEYEKMKSHAAEGERVIDSIISETGNEFFLQSAKLFAGHHHERWDGTGYPHGLKGAEISLQGRIMAIADAYDALVTARPYKEALPHESAVKIIRESSGTHFDPEVVDVFLKVSPLLYDIVQKGDDAL
jgi:putative two-component system response regulator